MEISWRLFGFGDMEMHYFFNSKDDRDTIYQIYFIRGSRIVYCLFILYLLLCKFLKVSFETNLSIFFMSA